MILVADEVWVAVATLSRNHPERPSFSAAEILARVRKEAAHVPLRAGVTAHIHQHCVANVEPSTARYRMLFRLPDGTYRLYREGDISHPERGGKTHPNRAELPAEYHPLLDWYERDYRSAPTGQTAEVVDPVLSMRGLGRSLWANVDPDEYVRSLRAGWEDHQKTEEPFPAASDERDIWKRLVRYQGSEFKTARGLRFTHKVDGDSGIWFFRDGRRINQRLSRREFEEALQRVPLHGPTDLKEFRDPSYLFGLITDRRITG